MQLRPKGLKEALDPVVVLRNDRGDTLISVLVAAGLMAVVSLGMAQMLVQWQRGMNDITAKGGLVGLIQTINTTLSTETTCQPAMSVAPLNMAQISSSDGGEVAIEIPRVGRLHAGTELQAWDIKVQSLKMEGLKAVGNDVLGRPQYYALLSVNATKVKEALGGATFKKRPIGAIIFSLNPGNTVARCAGENSPAFTCAELGGTYNATATPRCQVMANKFPDCPPRGAPGPNVPHGSKYTEDHGANSSWCRWICIAGQWANDGCFSSTNENSD